MAPPSRRSGKGIAAVLAIMAAIAITTVIVAISSDDDGSGATDVVAESGGPSGSTGTPPGGEPGATGDGADDPTRGSSRGGAQGTEPDSSSGSGGSTAPDRRGSGGDGDSRERSQPGAQPPAQTPGADEIPQGAQPNQGDPEPGVVRITIRDGKPVEGFRRIDYTRGDRVRMRVSSDETATVSIYGGYDQSEDIPAGGTAEFDFVATVNGSYEVQLFRKGVVLAVLNVRGDLERRDK